MENNKKRQNSRLARTLFDVRRNYQLLLFILLPLIWLIIFRYVPMVGVQIAFRKYTPAGGIWGSEWVGLSNFVKFLTSYQFFRVLPNTIRISVYYLLAEFPIPITLALLLNVMLHKRLRKTIQTVIYLPHFISTVVIVGMLFQLFNNRIGVYGVFMRALTGVAPGDPFATASTFPHMYVWSGIWQHMGWSTIIYTAALSGVDMELHEAAQIDGASRFTRLRYIDFPCILPTAIILLILSSGDILSVGFEKAYLMQNNLNLARSEVISTYVYKVGMTAGASDFSYASAIDLFNAVISLILLTIVNFAAKRISSVSLW